MTPRQKAEIWSDIDFAYSQLDSAIRLCKRGVLDIASGYLRSAISETRKVERRLNKCQ